MADPEKKICRYFNALGGCWYGDNCNFLHIPDKRPPCKFFWDKLSSGCRFGENCHFSHDGAPLRTVEQSNGIFSISEDALKEKPAPENASGRNNNNMAISSRLTITDPPKPSEKQREVDSGEEVTSGEEKNKGSATAPTEGFESELPTNDSDLMQRLVDLPEFTPDPNFQQDYLAFDSQIMCGTCKQILERRGSESYCNLLKDHYLECFLDKEGDHVKCVKLKAALDPGQMYWCKSCILIFEKPWSLFQHMADKAKGTKVQRWEKKVHLDWIDSVAGLMAGHDLGLFSLMKLRTDLRNLLADQHTMEEEMEAAAVAAAAMVQWLTPISSPWRLHQREMMRKIENLNRHILRRAGGAAAIARAAFAGGPNNFPFTQQGGSGGRLGARYLRNANQQSIEPNVDAPADPITREVDGSGQPGDGDADESGRDEPKKPSKLTAENVEESKEGEVAIVEEPEQHIACASGDHPNSSQTHREKHQPLGEGESERYNNHRRQVDSNNTNSVAMPCPRGDVGVSGVGRRFFNGIAGVLSDKTTCGNGRGFRGGMSANRSKHFGPGHRFNDRPSSHSFSQSIRHITSPTKVDLNCGFTDGEVEELLCQGIKPWDSEASAALAVLHGEMDHLIN
ncbi:unnamed protein product [Mesocestoides corti]|uniref:C3H1-type domain-containing protein n=3 Tax=Mesocestoides corti TaxID=53468 RepID=A0A0R3UG03_MESCO|nr:unnamed protein product [Mesocestoides corti]